MMNSIRSNRHDQFAMQIRSNAQPSVSPSHDAGGSQPEGPSVQSSSGKVGKLYWIATIIVFICLGLAWKVSPSIKQSRETSQIRETILKMSDEYQKQNQQLLLEFRKELNQAGSRGFNRARNNIAPFVNKTTEFSFCAKLCYAMTRDKIKKSHTTMDLLAPEISRKIIAPCMEGEAEIINCLNNFLLRLQENDNQYKAGIAKLLEKENFTMLDLGLQEDFLAKNQELAQKIQGFAMEKMLTTVGTAIEIAFIRSTYKCIAAGVKPIVARLITCATAGGTFAVADGPLPIGDIIGAIIAIGGGVWTIYDIHKVTRTLPAKMRADMRTMIDNQERSLRNKACEHAEAVLVLCSQCSREIRKSLDK